MSRSPVIRILLAVGVLAVAALAVLLVRTPDGEPPPEPIAAPAPAEPRPVSGVLRVSLHGAVGGVEEEGWTQVEEPIIHTGSWVNGPTYQGQSENDIRGFLDGRYRYAFNQASQIHTRVGRVGVSSRPVLGERELLRTLQRWADIELPTNARVSRARLELPVEEESPEDQRPSDLFLYQVHKDWHPGDGGVERNNFSAPARGEVWWNEAMRDSVPWGLPGAGFASDTDPGADTPVAPLDLARFDPGDPTIAFESEAMARYVQDRSAAEEPLLFLVKLSDYLEDTEGSIMPLYSSNHGDDRNTAFRPRLILEWSAPGRHIERPVALEYGRSLTFPRISARGLNAVSASFASDTGTAVPRILIRGGSANETSDWMDASIPLTRSWDWVQIRLDALVNPTPLGEPFRARFRDTWVPNGAPEQQDVPWVFVSPSGVVHRIAAEYAGDYTWEAELVPDEVGRWAYLWEQDFTGTTYRSPLGTFDVIVESREAGLAALERLTERIRSSELSPGGPRVAAFGPAFIRLERAILQLETPETFPMHEGSRSPERLGELLDTAREALVGTGPEGPRLPLEGPEY